MKRDLMLNRVKDLQRDYHTLLLSISSDVKSDRIMAVLDEICLFWRRNISTIQTFLKYYISNHDSYVFTAATYLDYSDGEHLPFLLLGKNHIMDDPLSAYASLYEKMEGGSFSELLLKQIIHSIEDNIDILENCRGEIIILPLRLLNQTPGDLALLELGESVFLSLFSDISSIDEVASFDTIEEIETHLRPKMERILCFSEHDDYSLSLGERIQKGMKEFPFISDEKSVGFKFSMIVYSGIQQSLDVVLSCIEYGCIPYLRSPFAFHYTGLLIDNIKDHFDLDEMKEKMCLAYSVHKQCDKEKLSSSGFSTFLEHRSEFNQLLNNKLEFVKSDPDSFTAKKVVPIISGCLEELYETLCENGTTEPRQQGELNGV